MAAASTAVFADDVVRPSRVVSSSPSPLAGEVQRLSRAAAATAVVNKTEQPAAVRPTRGSAQPAAAQPGARAADDAPAPQPARTAQRAAVSRSRQAGTADNSGARSAVPQAQSSRSATTRGGGGNLRPSVAEVGGRAIIRRSNTMTGSNIDDDHGKKVTRRSRAAVDTIFGAEAEVAETPSSANDLAGCSASYFDCLNQFCNVLDANQKQCSCSSRLTQYKKVEDSLTEANSELNNVAQQIRYVGLSADEIRSILKETEAEKVMSTMEDKTQSRGMLEEIERLIKSPAADAASGSSALNFDLDFSGDGDSWDINSLFGGSESFSNMRGTELYDAAKKKCKPILTRCATKKADQSIISGQYDIEIDKACIQYEAGLKKATTGVKTNIRSATQMLQKARLTVLGEQNLYDARGCVSALDACMRDDMVCGEKYYKCVDPGKTVIDESGDVIPGGDLVSLKDETSGYTAVCLDGLLDSSAVPSGCGNPADKGSGKTIVDYLKGKIGVMDNNGRVVSGFCRPVLDKCRRYTYSDGQYVDNNTVVKSYMERTISQIIAAQAGIVADYAKSCLTDVSVCYNGQITSANSYGVGTSLSPSIIRPILMGACRSVALSCAYSVFSDKSDTDCWSGDTRRPEQCITKLSEMFYQTLMCPLNSTWQTAGKTAEASDPEEAAKYVNSNCKCNTGYYVSGSTCAIEPALSACPISDSTFTHVAKNPATDKRYVSLNCICNVPFVASTIDGKTSCATPDCPSDSTLAEANNTVDKLTVSPYCKCKPGYVVLYGKCTAVTDQICQLNSPNSSAVPSSADYSTSIVNSAAAPGYSIVSPYCRCNNPGPLVSGACP
jgi:hypothetical protein